MPCSEARRLANQRNSTRSTGPRSIEGKNVARRNSTTHGLRGEPDLVPPHMADAVAKHVADLVAAYHPEGGHQHWLLAQIADAAARLDHCQLLMRAAHDDQMDRADLCWDVDRDAEIEALALRLPKNPARVAGQLRQSAQGCRWLLARWSALNASLLKNGGWDEAQRDRAAQLLGVGDDLRDDHPYLQPGGDPAELADLVAGQVAGLRELLVEALEPLDARERELTQMGHAPRLSKELARLRRYETRLRRVLSDSFQEFHRLRDEGFTGPLTIDSMAPIADCGVRIAESVPVTVLEPDPVIEPLQITALEPEPAPVVEPLAITILEPEPAAESLPLSSIPQSAIRNPQSEELSREEALAILAEKPQMAMLATIVENLTASLAGEPAPKTARFAPPSKKASKTDERKARRQREKAARKRARSH